VLLSHFQRHLPSALNNTDKYCTRISDTRWLILYEIHVLAGICLPSNPSNYIVDERQLRMLFNGR
jgi:hypothetical protein